MEIKDYTIAFLDTGYEFDYSCMCVRDSLVIEDFAEHGTVEGFIESALMMDRATEFSVLDMKMDELPLLARQFIEGFIEVFDKRR